MHNITATSRTKGNTMSGRLKAHLGDTQDRVIILTGLIEAATLIHDENRCKGGLQAILTVAHEIGEELSSSLDIVSLDRVEAG